MAGLLDFNDPQTRMGIGLLALGQMPRSQGMQGFLGLMQQQDQAAQDKADAEWKQQQIARQRQEWQRQDQENALAGQFFKPDTQGLAPLAGDSTAGILPSAGRPGVPASFDMQGYAQAMMAVNPKRGMELMQAMQKETPINKLDVKDFTPASVAKFAASKNYADLVRMDKAHFADTGGNITALDAFTGRPINEVQKSGNPFTDLLVRREDGSMAPNSPLIGAKAQIARAGASQNNISVNTEKSLLNEIAGGVGKQVDASLSAAKGAASTVNTLNNLDAALNSGKIMAGPATAPAQIALQLGTQLGLGGKNTQETLQNTRAAMQAMAQLELDAAGQMKGQGQITESERAILRKAASGDINMTLPELKTLSAVSRRTAMARIQQHNQNVQPLLQNPNAAAVAPFLTVQPSQGGAAGGNIIDFGSLK